MTTQNTYSVFYYIIFFGDNEVFKMLTSSENIVGQAWVSWWVGKVLNTVFTVKEGRGFEGDCRTCLLCRCAKRDLHLCAKHAQKQRLSLIQILPPQLSLSLTHTHTYSNTKNMPYGDEIRFFPERERQAVSQTYRQVAVQ